MSSILRMLDKFPDRKEILELFNANPDLYKVNWFRNDDYKSAQVLKSFTD